MIKMRCKHKKSQITIFIIVALLIVIAVALFFLFFKRIVPTGVERMPADLEPNSYIEKCAKDVTNEAIDVLMPHGGFIEPENYYKYKSENVGYLCYNSNYYNPCVMQYPKYIEHLENEIKKYTEPKIDKCFSELKSELQKRGYQINLGTMKITIELVPKKARVNVERKFKIAKNEETKEFEEFKTQTITPLYDLAIVTQEIAGQEAKYCHFEYVGYMLFYPDFNIDKFVTWDETKIYTVKHRDYPDKQLRFAIRSCAMPPGL